MQNKIKIMKNPKQKLQNSATQSQLSSSTTTQPQKRTAFKMVASSFEPPQQTYHQYNANNIKPQHSVHTKVSIDQLSRGSIYNYQNNNNFNSNVQFIASLVPGMVMRDKVNFDQGDCIPIQTDDRWIILSGEVRVVGVNQCWFSKGVGFIFFASAQTKRRIKQVISIGPVTALKLPYQTFKSQLRNFLFIKNSQKINFLQYCPFLPSSSTSPFSEDIALAMQSIQPTDKDALIYEVGSQADYLYFVKQGIILLERNGKSTNQVIRDFQKNYQTSYLGEDQGLVIVRKGMIFGVDGILIKEVSREVNLLESQNPEDPNSPIQPYQSTSEPLTLKSTRIYNAKSIGKCELYRLDKNILQTYLKSLSSSPNNSLFSNEQIHFSNKQLDRLCLQYTNLLMGSNSVCRQVKKKNFQLNLETIDDEIEKKRKRVEQIKIQQRKMKKVGHSDGKKNQPVKQMRDKQSQDFPSMLRSPPRKSKAQSLKKVKDISLPSLNRKNIDNLIFKKLQAKQVEKYMGYKKKVQTELFGKDYRNQIQKLMQKSEKVEKLNQIKKQKEKEKEREKEKQIKKIDNVQFMKVRSYRSLLSSLG